MKSGDRVEVIDETSRFYHRQGIMVGVARNGNVLVQFPDELGPEWEVEFKPFDLEWCPPASRFA